MFDMKRVIQARGRFDFNYDVLLSYDIFHVGNDSIARYIQNKKLLIVISKTIKSLYYTEVYDYFKANTKDTLFKIVEIKTGEANKNIDTINDILQKAKDFELGRDSLMVAIGGGILMDMVGMAASMYRRSIQYLRIPTTLLGQIDAGVGIKTGVNFSGSKNFIGSFYPPIACIICPLLLQTLPLTELQNGLSEILKMALIVDSRLFELLEDHSHRFLKKTCHGKEVQEINYLAIDSMIEQLKINFYERDLKRLVDFGHTFSPFIETHSNYEISHGFAVALDMAISTQLAYHMNRISLHECKKILTITLRMGLHIYNGLTFKPNQMYESLKDIVLHRGGDLNLVIPTGIGSADFVQDLKKITPRLLTLAFENLEKFERDFDGEYYFENEGTSTRINKELTLAR